EQITSVDRFCDIAEEVLMRHEAENNLILGKASTMRQEPRRDEDFLALVIDDDGRTNGPIAPIAVAMMTPPWPLIVTRGSAPAMHALAAHLHGHRIAVREVGGPAASSQQLAGRLAELSGRQTKLRDSLRIFQIDRVIAPQPAAGTMRVAGEADLDLLIRWMD